MSDAEQPKPSLVRKLAEVMAEVHRIPKRGHNDFHKYDFATESDIMDVVRAGLAQRHVMILPRTIGHDVREVESSKGGKSLMFVVNMTFAVMDGESGEVLECPWMGAGIDTGEKGAYKAYTGGEKYFLMKLFMMSTGNDPENERQKKGRPDGEKKRPAPPAEAAEYERITEAQRKTLVAAAKAWRLSADETASKFKAILIKTCNVEASADVPATKMADVLAAVVGPSEPGAEG